MKPLYLNLKTEYFKKEVMKLIQTLVLTIVTATVLIILAVLISKEGDLQPVFNIIEGAGTDAKLISLSLLIVALTNWSKD